VQQEVDGRLQPTGEVETLAADQVLKAIGQKLALPWAESAGLAIQGGRLVVDAEGRTALPGVWAGGDCVAGGRDLTVEAVEHGKQAALSIHAAIQAASPVFRTAFPAAGAQRRLTTFQEPFTMADLSTNFVGIQSPNPFWLASAPPTDKATNVIRAFEAGWGGVVWKTLGEDPPVVNVHGPRYSTLLSPDRRVLGLNNIELITDRPLDLNLKEIAQVKRDWPDRAMVVSLMVPCNEASWKRILPRVEDTGPTASS
jgi:hypothetical protein